MQDTAVPQPRVSQCGRLLVAGVAMAGTEGSRLPRRYSHAEMRVVRCEEAGACCGVC